MLTEEQKKALRDRSQWRDVEKAWDQFIETITDAMMDDMEHPGEDDVAFEMMDDYIEYVLEGFGYKFVGMPEKGIENSQYRSPMMLGGE